MGCLLGRPTLLGCFGAAPASLPLLPLGLGERSKGWGKGRGMGGGFNTPEGRDLRQAVHVAFSLACIGFRTPPRPRPRPP